ncbi:MAG: LysM repeat protein, partial [Planctomycetota bacterium]
NIPRSKPKPKPKPTPTPTPTPKREPAPKGEGKPPVVPPTPAASPREYIVKKGDILGRIAQKQLGSTRYVSSIRDLNPGLTDDLKIGQMLVLPASAKAPAKASTTKGTYRTYTISKGDTFERIARVELNSRGRVREIQDLNPNTSPKRLIPGKRLKLPLK